MTGGDVVGVVKENGLFKKHYIMVPPGIKGRVKSVMPAGKYKIETPVVEVEEAGKSMRVELFQPLAATIDRYTYIIYIFNMKNTSYMNIIYLLLLYTIVY